MNKQTWKIIQTFFIALVALSFVSSCSNNSGVARNRNGSKEQAVVDPNDKDTIGLVNSSAATYEIKQIFAPAIGTGADDDGIRVQVLPLDGTNTTPFEQAGLCKADGSGATPGIDGSKGEVNCYCQFKWTSSPPILEGATEPSTSVPRTYLSKISKINFDTVHCDIPAPYASGEIELGSDMSIQVIPAPGNTTQFAVKPRGFRAGGGGAASLGAYTGFCNSSGSACFANIARYSCYDRLKIFSKSVKNRLTWIGGTDNDGTVRRQKSHSATRYCWINEDGDAMEDGNTANIGGNSVCPANAEPAKQTAQSFYFNLYIKPNDRSEKSVENKGFVCPKVLQPLLPEDGVASPDQYPMDVTFTLATSSSPDFSIPVRAQSYLSQDPNSADIIPDVIGYAAAPNPNGTCGSIVDERGNFRKMYRLRRYLSSYPQQFDANGAPIVARLPAVDEIFVLDRPVRISEDPEAQQGTIKGPKPCNFSYFDHSAALELHPDPHSGASAADAYDGYGRRSWVATNHVPRDISTAAGGPCGAENKLDGLNCDRGWSGVNPDGVAFPNVDFDAGEEASCSSLQGVTQFTRNGEPNGMQLSTTHKTNQFVYCTDGPCGSRLLTDVNNFAGLQKYDNVIRLSKVYVRPARKWHPEYAEDTSFRACAPAPLEDHFRDAPLHISHTNKPPFKTTWCAATYPTHHNKLEAIEPATSGDQYVIPFTSSAVKNVNYAAIGLSQETATSCRISSDPSFNMPDLRMGTPAPGDCNAGPTKWTIVNPAGHPGALTIDQKVGIDGTVRNICATETCDRTIYTPTRTEDLEAVPLQAPPQDIKRMLQEDSGYACEITYDGKEHLLGSKEGKTPTSGCCYPGLVTFNTDATGGPASRMAAHLEPFSSNQIGNDELRKRFGYGCGTPDY